MKNLIKWYIQDNKFTEQQKNIVFKLRTENQIIDNTEKYKKLQQSFFNRMPFCNISNKNRCLTFNINATSLINQIFEKQVDDQTLVLTTRYEHNSVKDCLKKCKNVIQLNIEDIMMLNNFSNIKQYIKNYNKIFVYIIGTQLMTGEITPQIFFINLFQILKQQNKNFKSCIDDVHGMFLLPRDYSIFDYVIYTAHSLVSSYQMGCLISKDYSIGIKAYNWGQQYLEKLDIILNRKQKLFLFKNILTQYFSKLLSKKQFYKCLPCTAQHIFSIQTSGLYFTKRMRDNLYKYLIKIDQENYFHNHIRIRYQEFIKQDINDILYALDLLQKTLQNLQKINFDKNLFNK